jgi:type IV fimbrial biogenesis protein FimT
MKMHSGCLRGITLVEALVTLAIASIVAWTAMPSFQGLVARQRLAGVATQLATDLQYVRTEAVARYEPLRISFWSDEGGSCYAIHTGSHAQCGCSGAAQSLRLSTLIAGHDPVLSGALTLPRPLLAHP